MTKDWTSYYREISERKQTLLYFSSNVSSYLAELSTFRSS